MKLPDISIPGVLPKELTDFLAQSEFSSHLLAEMLQNQKDILPPLPERRNPYRQSIQPVIQILPETSVRHLLLQLLIGCCHDPHIHMDHLAASHPHNFPLLEHPQKLHLKGGTHALHFVQKEGALVSELKESGSASFFGSRKSALLISE